MKRLIVCCDGTWYSADKGRACIPSNAALISRMVAAHGRDKRTDEKVEQVVYYQTGVGAGQMAQLDSVWQGATGAGLEENVTTAYHYLANNYTGDTRSDVADEIFLFGFSRGAYTVRALAGMVTEMGLLWPQELNHFPDLYEVYKRHGNRSGDGTTSDKTMDHEARQDSAVGDVAQESGANGHITKLKNTGKFWKSAEETANSINKDIWGRIKQFHPDEEIKTKSLIDHTVKIKVIGVWDTVGSRGLPENAFTWMTGWNKGYQFHDTALNRKIDHAFHALSLDEHRGAFKPTLWYLDNPDSVYGAGTDLKQCWFPGYHADVGGGTTNSRSKDESDVDEIALAWMCDQVDGLLDLDEDACKALLLNKISQVSEPYKWAEGTTRDPIGWYNLPLAGGSVYRTPGQYNKNLENERCARRNGDFVTNETVHPSVHYRMNLGNMKYDPPAFKKHRGWFCNKGQGWSFVDHFGNGAQWVRGSVYGEREVKLDEWWIRQIQGQGRLNFEWNLLPSRFRDELKKRNERKAFEPERSEEKFPFFCRNMF